VVEFHRVYSLRSTVHVTLVKTQSFEPPSAWMVSPVIHRASSDARKAITPPMSSGCAMRFSAWMPSAKSRPASVLVKFNMSVSTTPGCDGIDADTTCAKCRGEMLDQGVDGALGCCIRWFGTTTARAASDERKTMLLPST